MLTRNLGCFLVCTAVVMVGVFVNMKAADAGLANQTWTVNLIVQNQSAKTVEGTVSSGGTQLQNSRQSFDKIDFPPRKTTTKTISFLDTDPAPYKHFAFLDSYRHYCTASLYHYNKRKNWGLPCVYYFSGNFTSHIPKDTKVLNINVTYGKDGFKLETNTGVSIHQNRPDYSYKPRY